MTLSPACHLSFYTAPPRGWAEPLQPLANNTCVAVVTALWSGLLKVLWLLCGESCQFRIPGGDVRKRRGGKRRTIHVVRSLRVASSQRLDMCWLMLAAEGGWGVCVLEGVLSYLWVYGEFLNHMCVLSDPVVMSAVSVCSSGVADVLPHLYHWAVFPKVMLRVEVNEYRRLAEWTDRSHGVRGSTYSHTDRRCFLTRFLSGYFLIISSSCFKICWRNSLRVFLICNYF